MRIASILAATLVFLATISAGAVPWQSLVQPHGTRTSIMTGAAANAGFPAASPPWDTGTDVTVTKTDRVEQYVRLYNPTDPSNPSNQAGRWIMRAADVRGKSVAQLRNDFALPAVPVYITIVRVPVLAGTGTEIWTGLAGPITGWGTGGSEQFYLNGSYIPLSSYINGQLLTAKAMSYEAYAAPGNNARIAAYLDSHIPSAYSDLENVYDILDIANYGDRANLRASLDNIGPAYYDALGETALNSARLFAEAARRKGSLGGKTGLWAEAQNGLFRRKDAGEFSGYSERVSGMAAGWTAFTGEKLSIGMAMGLLRADTNRADAAGSYGTDTRRIAIYSTYRSGGTALSAQISGGLGKTAAKRNIRVYGVDSSGTAYEITRTASSTPEWKDLMLGLSAEGDWAMGGIRLNPYAGGWYSAVRTAAFTEQGADSLNLTMSPYTRKTWIAEAGLGAAMDFNPGKVKLSPYVSAGWEYFAPSGNRPMEAALSAPGTTFTINGLQRQEAAFAATIGMGASAGGFGAGLSYKGEFREDASAGTIRLDTSLSF